MHLTNQSFPNTYSDTDYPLLVVVIVTSNSGRKIARAFLTAVKLVSEIKL